MTTATVTPPQVGVPTSNLVGLWECGRTARVYAEGLAAACVGGHLAYGLGQLVEGLGVRLERLPLAELERMAGKPVRGLTYFRDSRSTDPAPSSKGIAADVVYIGAEIQGEQYLRTLAHEYGHAVTLSWDERCAYAFAHGFMGDALAEAVAWRTANADGSGYVPPWAAQRR